MIFNPIFSTFLDIHDPSKKIYQIKVKSKDFDAETPDIICILLQLTGL